MEATGTDTATGTDVARLHRLAWIARDDVKALEDSLAAEKARRVEARVAAAVNDSGPVGEATTETTGDVARLESELEEARQVADVLAVRHREALAASYADALAEKMRERDGLYTLKAQWEAELAKHFYAMNVLRGKIDGLDLRVPAGRNLRCSAISGNAHELRDVARADPTCTISPTALDEAIREAEKIVRERVKTMHAARHDAHPVPGRVTARYDGTTGLLDSSFRGGPVQVESIVGRLPDGSLTAWEPVGEVHHVWGGMGHVNAAPVPQTPDPLKVARR